MRLAGNSRNFPGEWDNLSRRRHADPEARLSARRATRSAPRTDIAVRAGKSLALITAVRALEGLANGRRARDEEPGTRARRRRRPRRHGAASRGMTDALATAEAAALRYVSDGTPGIHRVRAGRGFRYVAADGSPVRDFVTRRRIRALAIPPAWTEVWICAGARGAHPGHWPRRQGAQAVPLPRSLARDAGRDQVRPAGSLRRPAAGHPSARGRGPRPEPGCPARRSSPRSSASSSSP